MIAGVSTRGVKPRIWGLRFLVAVTLLAAVLALVVTVLVDGIVLGAPPDQPTNVSPLDGATGVSVTPALGSDNFTDPDLADTHYASQWHISTVSDNYSEPVFDSGTDNVSLTQITIGGGILNGNTTYYWQVRYQDNVGEWSEWSLETSFATENRAPNQPVNQSPADGAAEVSLNPELRASIFSDPDTGDTHAASQWRITDNSSNTVFDSGTDNVSLQSISVPSGFLSDSDNTTSYYWQVRYQDNHGAWSDWSAQTSFTALNHAPTAPINESPADAAEGASLNPTLKSSAFADPDFGDTQVSSQWRITTTPGDYTVTVFDSGTDNVSLTQLVIASGILSGDVPYYWQVRHLDNHGAWSDWSTETSFTSANHAPSQPSAASPSDGATDTTIPVKLESSAFLDQDENDTQSASRWQITKTAGDYTNPICDRIELKSGGLTSVTVDSGVLNPGTTYYWHVQHQDNHGAWSDWSAESSFTPLNRPPAKPDGLSPASGATAVSLTPSLEAAFSDPDGSQDHKVSQWQLSTVQGIYDAPVFDSTSETTTITVPEGILNISTTYYWRVRHQDVQGEWSEWSDEASFTTRPALPPVDEGGGIPFWVWIIVGVGVAGIIASVIIWRVRSAG